MSCDDKSCGTGGWNGPKPGDPSNNSVLSATPAFGGIDLNWSFPTVNPFAVAHTRVFRGIIPDFAGATVIVDPAGGSFYFDPLPYDNVTYYYWIQFVSINGTYGEVIGPASAKSRDSIAHTIEQLTGVIDTGMLAQSLKTQIASIPEIDDKIFQEIENRLAANVALSNALAQVTNVSNETKTLLLNEVTQRQSADEAFVTSINSLFAQTAGNAAAINEEKTIRVAKDEAIATRLDTMAVALGPGINESIAAAITQERTVRVAAEGALASDITTLFSTTNANMAAINAEATTRSNATSAQANQINDLYAKVALVNGEITTVIQAAISNEQTVRANADGALASDINTLFSRANGADAAIQEAKKAVVDEAGARTSAINVMRSTIAGDINTTVNNAIAGEVANRNNAISGAVQTEANTRVARDGVLVGLINTAEANAKGESAQAEQRMTTSIGLVNNKVVSIGALYTMKLSVNGLIGGFGVYNDGTFVEAGFDVDKFWIGRTSASKRKPFIVVGSEVFIDNAIIHEVTIDKLRTASGGVIVEGGKIKAEFLDADNIVAKRVDMLSDTSGIRTAINSNGVQVYAASGGYNNTGLRVRMGIW